VRRLMTLSEVAEVLNISMPQAYALVRSGELPAIQIGGKKQWRVEPAKLEDFIAQAYSTPSESRTSESDGGEDMPVARQLDESERP
jgi:excisionase family DNA binding protein